MSRFAYLCQEALAQAYEARGGSVLVRKDRNGSRRVSIDGKKETSMDAAMRFLESHYSIDKAA